MRVTILGAGVFGASMALELAKRGATVTHVERTGPGTGTSSRGAGLVSEAGWHPTSLRLISRSIELFQQMSEQGEERGHAFRFHQTGSTTLLATSQVTPARELAHLQRREGVHVKEVAPEDLEALPRHASMRTDDVSAALHYPRDGWALPRVYSEVVSQAVRALGATIVRGPARLLPDASVEVDGVVHRADHVVVACGVWTRRVLATAGLDAPLLAYRTQALRLSAARTETLPILHDAIQGFYLRPGIPNHAVAGNGTTTHPEDVDRWRDQADPEFVQHTLRRLHHRFPYLPGDGHVEAWAGIEAATPDRLLLAGPHPRAPTVWLLAGGNGHGFMRAPATAESLAAQMMGKTPRIDLAAYAPARFGGSAPDFAIREGFSLETPA